MNENHAIYLVDVPIGGNNGFIWNRLHSEREQICEALVKDSVEEQQEILQTRLRSIDDALDRLMSRSCEGYEALAAGASEIRSTARKPSI